jgi:hypothetical protein
MEGSVGYHLWGVERCRLLVRFKGLLFFGGGFVLVL